MIISGTIQRKIYPQSLINWAANFVPQNNIGYLNFIFSGDGGPETLFSLSGGQIISQNGDLVGGYFSSENLNFSGNINSEKIDLYQDGSPLYLGLKRKSQGDIYNIVFDSSSSQPSFDFQNLTMIGDIPNVPSPVQPFLVLYPNEAVPFTIINSGDYDFNISYATTSNINFAVSGDQNLVVPAHGEAIFYLIYKNSTVTPSSQTVALQVYTDHGVQKFTPTISGAPIVNKQYSLSLAVPTTYVKAGIAANYNVNITNTDGAKIGIGINYVSGVTGNYYSKTLYSGNVYDSLISGYITGSGYLSSYQTGLVVNFNTGNLQYEYTTGSGIVSGFYIADDEPISGNYLITGYGLGSTILYGNTSGFASVDNINYSGRINIKGGYVTGSFDQEITGTGYLDNSEVTGILKNPKSIVFLPFTGILTGDFNTGEYYLKDFASDIVYVTGNFSKKMSLLGLGWATGERKTGILGGDFGFYKYDPGLYTFYTDYYSTVKYSGGHLLQNFKPVTNTFSGSRVTGAIQKTIVTEQLVDSNYIDFDTTPLKATGYVSEWYEEGITDKTFDN
jgi:hypothetical protein